ncbi:MAG: hypothetical protein ACLUSV_10005 [Streptococcus sp.]
MVSKVVTPNGKVFFVSTTNDALKETEKVTGFNSRRNSQQVTRAMLVSLALYVTYYLWTKW